MQHPNGVCSSLPTPRRLNGSQTARNATPMDTYESFRDVLEEDDLEGEEEGESTPRHVLYLNSLNDFGP